jgi:arylformamidase
MNRIIDVSQPVGEHTAVWPGDQPCRVDWTMRRDEGSSVNVAALTMSAHTGTHVDGPYHVDDDGARPEALPLEPFVGAAVVIDARGRDVLDADVLDGVAVDAGTRVLFRTRDAVDARAFPSRFAAISPALAEALGQRRAPLVGTDAPSVDPFDSKTLDAHRILGRHGVAILENLVLDDVRPGSYTLIALPLRLSEADSSPVRAVLIEDQRSEGGG